MGLFDSIKGAVRPDDGSDAPEEEPGDAKHVDRSAPRGLLDAAADPDAPPGGKHARRD